MITPKYKHDCDSCKFVGRLQGYDCYIHHNPKWDTIVARFGDDGPEYLSNTLVRPAKEDFDQIGVLSIIPFMEDKE